MSASMTATGSIQADASRQSPATHWRCPPPASRMPACATATARTAGGTGLASAEAVEVEKALVGLGCQEAC